MAKHGIPWESPKNNKKNFRVGKFSPFWNCKFSSIAHTSGLNANNQKFQKQCIYEKKSFLKMLPKAFIDDSKELKTLKLSD